MGCGKSKNTGVTESNVMEFQHKEVKENRPDLLRKDINNLYKNFIIKRDNIKPFLAEKAGISFLVDDERNKLMELLNKKDALMKTRQPLMDATWEKDADDIHGAFQKFTTDKSLLVKILCARTYWQIALIGEAFEQKFGVTLLEKVVNELTTALGSLLTGGATGLSKLLTYRIMPQNERDAAFLRDFTNGISVDDANFLEIVCTRTNAELSAAIETYSNDYGKDLVDIIKQKCSYKNYREFVLRILECEHDESREKLTLPEACHLANELHAAGAARSIGIDPEPFIRILGNLSSIQFEQINEQYPKKQLIKDIQSKTGGDFQMALVTRVADKYEYLAGRLEAALKGFSPNYETLNRILGSLSRPHCVLVRSAFNRMGFKRTLEEALKSTLKNQQNYLTACLTLISDDLAITPLGSDKEIADEEAEVSREADRQVLATTQLYRRDKTIERGQQIMNAQRKARMPVIDEGLAEREAGGPPVEGLTPFKAAGVVVSNEDVMVNLSDEDRILAFEWDGKGRFMDAPKLTATFRELETVDNIASLMLERLGDEIKAMHDMYGAILKHRFETEAYIRIYSNHVRCLKEFLQKRESKAGLATIGSTKKF